jgi:hypothetical protein
VTWTRQQRDKHRGKCPGCGESVSKKADCKDELTGLVWHVPCLLMTVDLEDDDIPF